MKENKINRKYIALLIGVFGGGGSEPYLGVLVEKHKGGSFSPEVQKGGGPFS